MKRTTYRSSSSPSALEQPAATGARAGCVAAAALALAVGGGCAMLDVKTEGRIKSRKGWVLLPVQNLGETHMAGERVEELLTTLLRIQNNVELAPYAAAPLNMSGGPSGGLKGGPALAKDGKDAKDADSDLDLDERQHYERVLAWARDRKFSYGIGGSVQEWRYRAGTEGEPAVGLTLRVIELGTGRTVFTAAGASPTPGRGSLSSATQALLRSMLTKLPLDPENQDP